MTETSNIEEELSSNTDYVVPTQNTSITCINGGVSTFFEKQRFLKSDQINQSIEQKYNRMMAERSAIDNYYIFLPFDNRNEFESYSSLKYYGYELSK